MRLLLALILIAGCTKAPAPMSDTSNPQPPAATAVSNGPRVTFPDGFVVKVEIAAEPERRAEGLMFRDHLAPGTGMLFLFPQDDYLAFWMKNTRIPLDMVFMDAQHRIVGVEENVPPCKFDPCPSYGPDGMSRYVLEVSGGVTKQHNLKAGDVLRFEGTENIAVR